jgi:tRNA pseudouridine55 synthase
MDHETKPSEIASQDDDKDKKNGTLVVDKPAGMTSHDVVARVRKLLKTRRVGHTGTLDPFATGVLVLCINRATRLSRFLTGDDKEYLATMRLGFTTDTGDLTGRRTGPIADARHISSDQITQAMAGFRGRIRQTPPMYSAKKVGGVKLYELARRGEEIERAPVEVAIHELELIGTAEISPAGSAAAHLEDNTRAYTFRVICSSGTYIRTLAEDLGAHLGVGAHLTALRRTRAGRCRIEQAQTLEQLAAAPAIPLAPMAEALGFQPVVLSEAQCKAVRHGRSVRHSGNHPDDGMAKLCSENGDLIAVAEFDPGNGVWRPVVVLETASAD